MYTCFLPIDPAERRHTVPARRLRMEHTLSWFRQLNLIESVPPIPPDTDAPPVAPRRPLFRLRISTHMASSAAGAAGAAAPPLLAKQAVHRLNAGVVRALRVRAVNAWMLEMPRTQLRFI